MLDLALIPPVQCFPGIVAKVIRLGRSPPVRSFSSTITPSQKAV